MLLLAVGACGDDDDDSSESDAQEIESSEQEVTVVASDELRFDPTEITVSSGSAVHVTLDNSESSQLHDFSIDEIPIDGAESEGAEHDEATAEESSAEHGEEGSEAGAEPLVHAAAEAGESATVEFTPTDVGSYTFYCSVPGHRDAGMEGALTVE